MNDTTSSRHRLSAITLATRDMSRSVRFYESLGFEIHYGGEQAGFTSFEVGETKLNLIAEPRARYVTWWGRAIFWVPDVDAFYEEIVDRGLKPHAPPSDASWGERYFHITDPDGHELSFATPL